MKGIFSVLVENRDGVLSGISGLFARRGFNIDSHEISSMTIVSTGDQRTIDQIEKQLNKKVDVIKVRRLSEARSVCLEMMLIKLAYTATNRSSIIELCQITGARILKVTPKHLILEYHAPTDEVEDFIQMVKSFGIAEVQRTGAIAMEYK